MLYVVESKLAFSHKNFSDSFLVNANSEKEAIEKAVSFLNISFAKKGFDKFSEDDFEADLAENLVGDGGIYRIG